MIYNCNYKSYHSNFMSHFTHIKTQFQNLLYLEKALTKINISYRKEITESAKTTLIIPQSNGYNIEFVYNGNEYELIADMSFWEQKYPFESFIDKISQQYASNLIIGESQKIGFQTIKSKQNVDGSQTLTLERWNS